MRQNRFDSLAVRIELRGKFIDRRLIGGVHGNLAEAVANKAKVGTDFADLAAQLAEVKSHLPLSFNDVSERIRDPTQRALGSRVGMVLNVECDAHGLARELLRSANSAVKAPDTERASDNPDNQAGAFRCDRGGGGAGKEAGGGSEPYGYLQNARPNRS